ncbi:mismatch-specific DNA-glycosylase [Neobacillus notoginsengisoli]|uniref:Mismatch-specific DNA-glycosylase n=1 Tax=Neobacillus notoginsengisoli TaxID=1578198 RepID=A0A417YXH1_9BACI|nr:mismatch-specific DNA-glycosylase [Neobacillus notoginsengisoli]RHW42188.1 mismatch-specific DNA-glycosylase [Neobacillus notoginsengisoli]
MLRDHIRHDLDILFIGFNPSLLSGKTGHHFASPNNRFWKILHEASITPRKYKSEEDYLLPEIGLGLTNIVARPTKAADEITKEEYRVGREILKEKIKMYRPLIACFVGKGVYQQYSLQKDVPWGAQSNQTVPGTTDFVAPSSSGLVRIKMDEIVRIYSELPGLAERLKEHK